MVRLGELLNVEISPIKRHFLKIYKEVDTFSVAPCTLPQYCLVYRIINLQRERERREQRTTSEHGSLTNKTERYSLQREGERRRGGDTLQPHNGLHSTHTYTRILYHKQQPTPLLSQGIDTDTECLVLLIFRILKLSQDFIAWLFCASNAYSAFFHFIRSSSFIMKYIRFFSIVFLKISFNFNLFRSFSH